MSNTGTRTLLRMIGLGVALALPLGVAVLHRQLAVDTCLDRGGCFDYAEGSCVFDRSDESRCAGPHSWLPPNGAWLGPATAITIPVALALLAMHDRGRRSVALRGRRK